MERGVNVETNEWPIGRLLTWTTDYLRQHDVDEPRLATEVLLAHALDCQRIELYARFDQLPAASQVSRFRDWVRRAAAQEPIAYLVGQKEFYSLSFAVTQDVLIPRPETEMLVESAIDFARLKKMVAPKMLDFGTGSGCIAIAILHQIEDATVVASDISPAALILARTNAERHGVGNRLTLLEWDGPGLDDEAIPAGGFDIVVSNPPYVPKDTLHGLSANVREYEPSIALSDGADGLTFYRRLATEAPRLLTENGALFVEVEAGKGIAVTEAMEGSGALAHLKTVKDRVVGQDRVVQFVRTTKAEVRT